MAIPSGYEKIKANTLYENVEYYIDTSVSPTDYSEEDLGEDYYPFIYSLRAGGYNSAPLGVATSIYAAEYIGTMFYNRDSKEWSNITDGKVTGFDTLNFKFTTSPDWLYVKTAPDYSKVKTIEVTAEDGTTVSFAINTLQESKDVTITANGTTAVTADDGYDGIKTVNITTNVEGSGGGGVELNIHYGDTAPEDTSKLWIVGDASTKIESREYAESATTIDFSESVLYSACACVGDNIYCFGGRVSSKYIDTIYKYNITNNTFAKLSTTLPTANAEMGVGVYNDKIYLFGGNQSKTTICVFNTNTETISTLSVSMPRSATGIGFATVGSKVYMFGGYTSSGYSNAISVFDMSTNTVSTLSKTMSYAGHEMQTGVKDSKIYIFGGYWSNGPSSNYTWVFDTTDNTYSIANYSAPYKKADDGNAFLFNDNLYLFAYNEKVAVYNTTQNIWLGTLNVITPLNGMSTVRCGDFIYAIYSDWMKRYDLFCKDLANGVTALVKYPSKKMLNIINTDNITITHNISKVYRGGEGDVGEAIMAKVYMNNAWVALSLGTSEITFSIDGTSYTAIEGMTWLDWVNSEYNTSELSFSGSSEIWISSVDVLYVSCNDIIIPNLQYTTVFINPI